MDVSIIIPCYCSGNNIVHVINQIDDVMKTMCKTYEIIMVNDGSPDNTFEIISNIAKYRVDTYAIDLAKNSGQHAAILAGFHYAKGEVIATCEDDGQTQIEALPEMIEKLNEGYDVAAPIYKERGKRSLYRQFGTKCAIAMGKWMIPRPEGILVPIFFVAKRFIIREIIRYNQPYPYIEGLILRSTFNIALIEGKQKERLEGESGYTFRKMFSLWLNGFTSFSIKPLRLSIMIGCISAIIGVITGVYVVINKIINDSVLLGWSSTVAIMLFMFGMVLVVLGMIGEYVGRIYLCINQTPQYIVRQIVDGQHSNDA